MPLFQTGSTPGPRCTLSRRDLLRGTAALGGAAALSALPRPLRA